VILEIAMNVLFVCSQNMLRSPTAEKTFAAYPGITTGSAGTDVDAEKPVQAEMIQWADMIFVMEKHHADHLHGRFADLLEDKRPIILGISDDYEYMDPKLVEILTTKVTPHLHSGPCSGGPQPLPEESDDYS
jgi:predicted protein tyrosine phosphatase